MTLGRMRFHRGWSALRDGRTRLRLSSTHVFPHRSRLRDHRALFRLSRALLRRPVAWFVLTMFSILRAVARRELKAARLFFLAQVSALTLTRILDSRTFSSSLPCRRYRTTCPEIARVFARGFGWLHVR